MASYPTLIVHIGAGKTGTTSIQFTLKKARDKLRLAKLAYLGLSLEHAPGATEYSWCVPKIPQALFLEQASNRSTTDKEVEAVLLKELERLGSRGFRQAIWSNEAFFVRPSNIIPILRKVRESGVQVVPIVYVRRHDSWAQSGYVQFGIKYKSYDGHIRNFKEWLQGQDISYTKNLKIWLENFPNLEIYNFDSIDNVTEHFLSRIGSPDLETVRANDKPGLALLAAWAVHNASFPGKVMPSVFQKLAKRLGILQKDNQLVPSIDQLLPNEEDIFEVQRLFKDDLGEVNKMLEDCGQPPMHFDTPSVKRKTISSWDIDQMMLTMIFSLQRQVINLEEEIQKLRDKKLP
ncbi:hypothetical protein [Mangrovicoccus sp. HB161399]|uniref:hypothetical protein n=1 Tax=Mangrovicoccus sp. HB161399 TaxID=2720392 RepID=UPI001554DE1A|nr:hypothetical protein [Mangrovicoccus sp. HB161399]